MPRYEQRNPVRTERRMTPPAPVPASKPKSATPKPKSGTNPRPTPPPSGTWANPGVDADGNPTGDRRNAGKVPQQPLPPITDRRGGAEPGQPINQGRRRGRG
jgi:hypothetical protein